ncbi:amidase [Agrobacterium rhizogenes]|nr:amidase [Rhizobium rhizogenes]NTG16367.1 amidase [Rhizobium rhizogenes]NTG23308.1 amidase [Rhizobium rhizogenes]NTG32395.1 amidase [Rhizobium rhizogenes]NTG39191.1 amidase [Rhizobium rhizogenes]
MIKSEYFMLDRASRRDLSLKEIKHLTPFTALAERNSLLSQSTIYWENWRRRFDKYARTINSKISALTHIPNSPSITARGVTSASYKDLISVKGITSKFGSDEISVIPPESAAIVVELENAGIFTQGKARTTEFGVGNNFSSCINPLFPLFSPGGSSNGSAAAVASGISDVSFGTDAAGSVRRPASFCGAVGIVFSESEEHRRGIVPVSSSLERIGAVTRSIDDILYLWKHHDLSQIYPQEVSATEGISLVAPYLPKLIDEEIARSFEDYVAQIRAVGFSVERVNWNIWPKRQYGWKMVAYELHQYFDTHRELFPMDQLRPSTRQTIQSGKSISLGEYQDACAKRDVVVREMEDFITGGGFSAILLPVDPYPVSRVPVQTTQHMLPLTPSDQFDPWNYMIIANLCNLSAISYPFRVSSRGFPMAVQIFARARSEILLMETAKALSDLLPRWIETHELVARRKVFEEAASDVFSTLNSLTA